MFKLAAINALLLCLGLVVVELVFGTWFSETHALHQFTKPRNVALVHDNPFPGGRPRIRYTRDRNGFRGLDGPVSGIDLVTVGGSTTDQRWIDDDETYQGVLRSLFLQEGRTLHVANAGIDGQSTVGHIANFTSWFDRIDGFRTRFVLYYVGINDVLNLSGDRLYDVVAADSPRLRLQLFIREKSALYQLYLIARQMLFPDRYRHSLDRTNFAIGDDLVSRPNLEDYDLPEFVSGLQALSDRVQTLVELTRGIGAEPIFVTQRSARWTRIDGRVLGIAHYQPDFHEEAFRRFGEVNGVDIHNIERRVADAILAPCRASHAVCLDLFSEIEFDLAHDFYDPIHTTPSGSRAIGTYLYRRLRDVL